MKLILSTLIAPMTFDHFSIVEPITIKWGRYSAHLNSDKIESNMIVPGIPGHQKNALIKSFEMRPYLICL